jgi:hypothetical protein
MIVKHIAMNAANKSSIARLVSHLTDTQGKEVRTGAVRITNCISGSAEATALEVLNTQAMNTRSTADKTYHLIISFRPDENPDAATRQVRPAVNGAITNHAQVDHQEVLQKQERTPTQKTSQERQPKRRRKAATIA